MAEFTEVPVIEVHNENFKELWPTLIVSIKSATFVALDAELSGLGERRKLFAKSMDDRYKGMCETAKTRSILSLGLSCFKIQTMSHASSSAIENGDHSSKANTIKYAVQTFNIFVLCSENYTVEPMSLKFLVEHGFDFNRQYAKGLPYYRGNDKKEDLYEGQQTVRELFIQLALSKVPLVFHNGLVDLAFLYENFYANIPSTVQTFMADLEQIFAGGVYDTKYMTEYKARMTASFLEYVFRKSQRENLTSSSNGWCHVETSFYKYPGSMSQHVVMLPCGIEDKLMEKDGKSLIPCEHFASHGWCSLGPECKKSHDVDAILNCEDSASKKKKRKKFKHEPNQTDVEKSQESPASHMETEQNDVQSIVDENRHTLFSSPKNGEQTEKDKTGIQKTVQASRTCGHRAGFDAFMTGFIFAFFGARYGKITNETTSITQMELSEFANKIFLSGKDFPLTVAKSNFAKCSKDHQEKYDRICKTRK